MRLLLRLAIVITIMFSAGCAREQTDTELVEHTYQFLNVSSVVYDTAMKVAADAHKRGLIDDRQWDSVKSAGTVYYDSYQAVVSALGIYMELIEDLEGHHFDRCKLRNLLTECSRNLTLFVSELDKLGVSIRGAGHGN